jgi:iron(III) transport system substrate-binding protein
LWRAEQAGLFQPIKSETLESRVPANLRHPEALWFGFSSRARLIFYNKDAVQPGEIGRYEDLAEPKWRGRICVRSSSNIYNQSLMGAMIAAHGEPGAEAWAKAVTENFARKPVGGDTDQLRGAAAGECDVAIANSYYYARLKASKKAADREVAGRLGVVFPNQEDRGSHINISGAGVLKHAPNQQEAVRFMEYLTSPEAQGYFADGNNEYPVVAGVTPSSVLESLGAFKPDTLNVSVFGENQPSAQRIFDRAGWR